MLSLFSVKTVIRKKFITQKMPLIAKTGSITLIAYGHLKKLDKVKRIQNEKKEAIDRGRTYQKRKSDQYK